MARVYATPTDWQAYTGQAPDAGTLQLLADASRMLESVLFRLCHYVPDPITGMPISPTVLAAFSDAVCAQAQWWLAVGDTIGIGGVGTYATIRIGTMHLQDPKVGTASASAARQIAPKAYDALRSPDLTGDIFRMGGAAAW